jgi:hypothetical protein
VSDEQARRVFRELQALARADYGGNTGALLVMYGVEGFLRRLAASVYASKMTLKGGMLMAAISARRMTKDADLSTRGVGNEEVRVAAAVSAAHRELGDQVPRLRVRRAVVVAAQQPVDELCRTSRLCRCAARRPQEEALRRGISRRRDVLVAICETDDALRLETCVRCGAGTHRAGIAWLPMSGSGHATPAARLLLSCLQHSSPWLALGASARP